ncbi:uncharacterized protein PAC_05455 [Phialocephala subalpina]|uniref:Uncharacterized protein n=1 Tax=Phialocephala subalpina TaxID=576137 RepID=A0A1L7WS18_9HELO|nr:uncharacterized protein PAC_05455 [Phialocephala subalpina]
MSSEHVLPYTGIWKYYNEPSSYHLIWTLSAAPALAVLAFFSALLAYTQTRWWILSRYLLIRSLHRFHLDDPEDSFSLWNLSQLQAIQSLIGKGGRLGTMITVSPWLGICSIVNLLIFTSLGALLPFYLTGYGATPVVRARGDTGRDTFKDDFFTSGDFTYVYFKHCWLNSTVVDPKCGGANTLLNHRPLLSVSRDVPCPFPGNVCVPSVSPIQVEHRNLLPFDFGINLEPDYKFSHRATCAPIQTEPFIDPTRKYQGEVNSSLIWFGKDPAPPEYPDPFSGGRSWFHGRFLHTKNGPNRFSDYWSGRADFDRVGADLEAPYVLDIFPSPKSPLNMELPLHPSLERLDGQVFIALLLAEHAGYFPEINDPLYAAHGFGLQNGSRIESSQSNEYVFHFPDYEATALGCFEQFQVCVDKPRASCTEWGPDYQRQINFWDHSHNVIMSDLSYATSLNDYLRDLRPESNKLISTWSHLSTSPSDVAIDQHEQWVIQVRAWMETSLLDTRATYFQLLRFDSPTLLLFNDVDYTNIEFTGFASIISALLLLCLLSFAESIQQYCRWLKPRAKKIYIYGALFCVEKVAVISSLSKTCMRALGNYRRRFLNRFQNSKGENQSSIRLETSAWRRQQPDLLFNPSDGIEI